MSTTFVNPYHTPSYTPHYGETDDEIRRQLEVEVLQQWYEAEDDALPPDYSDVDPETVEGGWEPASAAQRIALECPADIILYGGSAGSLKSETLMVNAAAEFENPQYNGIVFRASFPELRDLIKKSIRLYKPLGGKFTKGSPMLWTFPSGATIWLGYLGHDDDVFQHQGQEYSFVGFDEGGHQTEARIRYMLTRLRSTDPTLRIRMFITANPGGPGHSMLMHMFLKGICPHCEPSRCVEPGKLYFDATWKSDGQPLAVTLQNGRKVARSVAFIPGKITDHNLLGEEYIANLMMQAAATAKMLMDGCWKAWEGQFFDVFSERRGWGEDGRALEGGPDMRMVVPRTDLQLEWWYPHLASGDYGFAGSSAAGHLIVQIPPDLHFPKGRFLVLDEYLEKGVTAKDFPLRLLEKWVLEEDRERPGEWRMPGYGARNIQQWVVSPDAWRKDGVVNDNDVAFSRLEQMNEVLGRYGFAFSRANDDRKSGWMRLYQLLRDGELIICRHCVKTIEMFQTRLRDPKKLDDILKVPGDELDDVADCLRYGIMTWGMAVIKPKEIRVAEAIKDLDPTNAMMTIRQFELEERRSTAPISFSPKAQRGRRGPW